MDSRRHVPASASRLCALLLALAVLALGLVTTAVPAEAATGTVSLTAPPGYFATDTHTVFTATLSQTVAAFKTVPGDPDLNILVKDMTDNTIFAQCIGQTSVSCAAERQPQADQAHQFVAYVGRWDKTTNTVIDIKATSPTVVVRWRPFSPQLAVTRTPAGVELLATVSQATRNSGYGFLIYNQTANRVEAQCFNYATSCTTTLSASAVQPTDTFVALIAQSRTYTGVPPSIESSPVVSLVSPGPSAQNLRGGMSGCVPCSQKQAVDPVNTATGTFWETTTDLAVAGRGPALAWTRNYSAALAAADGPLGYGWRLGYGMGTRTDPSTGAVTVTEENGSEVVFTPNGSGGYTAASNVLADLTVPAGGGLRLVRRQGRAAFLFDTAGRLVSVSDRNGETTTLAYDGTEHLATVTDPAGRAVTVTWTGTHVTGLQDVAGRTVGYSYSAAGDLTGTVSVTGKSTSYTYDGAHRLLTVTDPRGGVTTNVYDTSGRVTSQTDRAGKTTGFAYSASGGLDITDVTDPRGTVHRYHYWGNVLVQETHGFGTPVAAVTKYAYDPKSLGVIAVTDPNGLVTTGTYDADGNRTSATDPNGATTTTTWSASGDLLTRTTTLDVTTTNAFDATGNLTGTAVTAAGVAPVTVSYAHGNAAHKGDVTASTDPRGKTTTYAQDVTTGAVTSVTDPLGRKTTTTYDALSRPLTTVSPRGNATGGVPGDHRTTLTYDQAGRVLTTTDPAGHLTTTTYDPNGNTKTVTDPNGKVTSTAYDPMDRPTAVTRPDLTVVGTTYDMTGNAASQTDAANRVTAYAYDQLGRTTTATDPGGRATGYTYDPGSRPKTQTDPAGAVVTYAYDPDGRLAGKTYPTGTTNIALTYDKAGRRTRTVDALGTTNYTYDTLDRLTVVSGGGVAGDRAYAYDQAGNVTSVTYPNGQKAQRTYDDAGQWTGLTDWTAQQFTFAYDPDGEPTGRTDPNGTTETRAYDNTGQTTTVTHKTGTTTLASFGYGYDLGGRNTTWTPTGTGATARTYTYTDNSRVKTVNAAPYTWSAGDDLTGTPDGTVLGYDTAAQPTTLTPTTGTATTYTYDSSGNRTGQTTGTATTALAWDRDERLTAYTAAGTTAYTYGADGLRGSKKVGAAAAEKFAWDITGQVPLLMADNTNMYLWGPGRTLLEQKPLAGGTTVYAHEDGLGTVHALTGQTGTVVATSTYDTHGRKTGSTGTVTSPFGWAGEYQDTESGLIYLRARYYDPASGQFLSRDPLVVATRDPYGYADGNPVTSSDPSGLSALCGLLSPVASLFGCHRKQTPPSDEATWAAICDADTRSAASQTSTVKQSPWDVIIARRRANPGDLAARNAEHYITARDAAGSMAYVPFADHFISVDAAAVVGYSAAKYLAYTSVGDIAFRHWPLKSDAGSGTLPDSSEVRWGLEGTSARYAAKGTFQ